MVKGAQRDAPFCGCMLCFSGRSIATGMRHAGGVSSLPRKRALPVRDLRRVRQFLHAEQLGQVERFYAHQRAAGHLAIIRLVKMIDKEEPLVVQVIPEIARGGGACDSLLLFIVQDAGLDCILRLPGGSSKVMISVIFPMARTRLCAYRPR